MSPDILEARILAALYNFHAAGVGWETLGEIYRVEEQPPPEFVKFCEKHDLDWELTPEGVRVELKSKNIRRSLSW